MKKFIFFCFLAFAAVCTNCAWGQVFVSEASIEVAGNSIGWINLPYYYEGGRTSLQSVTAKYILPQSTEKDDKFYGVLIPYPVQGGGVYMNGRLIYELEASSNARWVNWYRPVLINVSARDFNSKSQNFLEFRQVGHLRGWVVLPVFWGALSDLRPIYEKLFYLSQTLVETINFLCAFVGGFLVLIGVVGRQKKYIYPGAAAIVWVLLFKLALLPSFDSSSWYLWRLSLYFLTGNVILLSSLFLINFFSVDLKFRVVAYFASFCQLGWVAFLLVGAVSEYYLDMYWTGGVVLAYVCCVFYTFFARNNVSVFFAILFSLYLLASGVFALHDFAIQAGFLFDFRDDLLNIVGNAIYLSHFSLPAFLITACVLLTFDYFNDKSNLKKVLSDSAKIRDEILSDIHDGVGARLNVLLMGLELKPFGFDNLKEDVRRCVNELRFVLISKDEKTPFLLKLIIDFCSEISIKFAKKNIKFDYLVEFDSVANLSPKLALVLYFSTLECLSNIVKHAMASATYVNYSLTVTSTSASLFIQDDGPGIDGWNNDQQCFLLKDFKVGLGIKSLISRVTANAGRISIITTPNEATTISIVFEI